MKQDHAFQREYAYHTLVVPIQLEPNCAGVYERYESGDYWVVVGGMDAKDRKERDGLKNSLCQIVEVEEAKKLTYEIIEMQSTVYRNERFDVVLKIDNDDEEDAELETWSYVFRGKKNCCLEMENLKYIRVEEEDTKEVRKNKVKEAMKVAISLKRR